MGRSKASDYVIGYMSGPADGAEIVRRWKQRDHTDYFGTVYMTQFCDVVREAGARGLILTYRSDPDTMDCIDEFTIYNLERKARSGLGYHLELATRMLRSFMLLWRHRARFVILT